LAVVELAQQPTRRKEQLVQIPCLDQSLQQAVVAVRVMITLRRKMVLLAVLEEAQGLLEDQLVVQQILQFHKEIMEVLHQILEHHTLVLVAAGLVELVKIRQHLEVEMEAKALPRLYLEHL
jgi:hypothetical protein